MPRTKTEGFINWKKSKVKQIILSDLRSGTLQAHVTAQEAWEVYLESTPVFSQEKVVFAQFRDRLRDHRKLVMVDITRATAELEYLEHDRQLFPRQMENHRGEPVFDLSEAKLLLRNDVAEGRHLNKTPHELQQSRVEYQPFNARKFTHRIYQEVRRIKFINHMNDRRERGLS
jgi:hypothetical protein